MDSNNESVSLPQDLELDDIVLLTDAATWIQRWPRVQKVTLPWLDARVCMPFASAAPEGCRHITELVLGEYDEGYDRPLHSSALHNVLSRLPGLHTLAMYTVAPAADDPLELRLARHALSALPTLTSLTMSDYGYLSCLPNKLLAQLTFFEVTGAFDLTRPPTEEIATVVSQLTALRDLKLGASGERPTAEDLSVILDALPPSVLRMEMTQIEPDLADVTCSLADGQLTEVRVSGPDLTCGLLLALLARGLLPSRALGPRLGRLVVERVLPTDGLALLDGEPAAAVLARCDQVSIKGLFAMPTVEENLALLRILGLPNSISWNPSPGSRYCDVVQLRRVNGEEAAAAAGGADGVAGVRASRPVAVLPLVELVRRALSRMRAREGGPRSGGLLLSGPLMRRLSGDLTGLRAWMERLGSAVTAANPSHQVVAYRPLPTAGAVVVTCKGGDAACDTAAAASQQLAADDARSTSGGAEASVGLEAALACTDWPNAIQSVLQALWDGAEEEEEGVASGGGEGGSGAPSGNGRGTGTPAASGPEEPPAGGRAGGELDRVRCLLDTWAGLGSLPWPEFLGDAVIWVWDI